MTDEVDSSAPTDYSLGCEVCERRGRENTSQPEHRLIHIEMPEPGKRQRLYVKFVDGAGMSVSADIPDLAKTVGEWFLNELGFLPRDLKATCPTCGGLIVDLP